MRQLICILLLAMATSACTTSGGQQADELEGDFAMIEDTAYQRTGDVRIYYYIKPARMVGAHAEGVVEQRRMLAVLINRGHSSYQGLPESRMLPEERFLYNADMHDLLVALQRQIGFFERGMSVNIRSQDPVERANNERDTSRMIAVQQIKDGEVNTSYFGIAQHEESKRRFERFEEAQALILYAIGEALPRGQAGQGSGEHDTIGRR